MPTYSGFRKFSELSIHISFSRHRNTLQKFIKLEDELLYIIGRGCVNFDS